MALSRHYSENHGTINKPPLHEAYTVQLLFVEQPSCHSLYAVTKCMQVYAVTKCMQVYVVTRCMQLRSIHRAVTVTFVEQPSCHSLDICENKWYHLIDAQINIQNMILPHVK